MVLFDPKAFEGDAAAARVVADIAAAKWRRARDGAKELTKKDKERYAPLVVAANAGLAHEMLSRGLTKDAEPVLAILEKSASPEVLAWVRGGAAALPVVSTPRVVAAKGFGAESWALLVTLAAALEAGGPGAEEGWRAADMLAGATKAPPAPPEAVAVEGDWRLIQRAVEAAGAGDWDAMQEALRGLPRASVFQHWRMLLRGVRAVHTGEPETAARCFAALPAGSAPARAALPWKQYMGGDSAPAPAADAVLAALCGVPAVWIEACRLADAALRTGRRREAWKILRAAMKDDFPTPEPGFVGECTRVVLHTRAPGSEAEEKDCDALMELVYNDCADRRLKKSPQHLGALIFYCGCMETLLHHEDLESLWIEALELANRQWARLPLRDAVVWHRLAKHYRAPEQNVMQRMLGMPAFGGAKQKLHDPKAARRALDLATKLDPLNAEAAMDLADLLEHTGDASARNKLLDDVVKRAPENPLVLLKAGALAIERKAFGKGLDMLRQARALDPLDAAIAREMAAGLIGQARDRQKKRPSAAQDDIWQELESLAVDRCDRSDPVKWPSMLLERWGLRVRRSLLDAARADQAAAEAERMAPSLFGCLLLHGMLTEVYLKVLPAAPALARLEAAAAAATWSDLLEALQHWCQVRGMTGFTRLSEMRWMQYILKAAHSRTLPQDDAAGAWRVAMFLENADLALDGNVQDALRKQLVIRLAGAVKKPDADVRLAAAWLLLAFDYSDKTGRMCRKVLAQAKAAGMTDVVLTLEGLSQEFGIVAEAENEDDDETGDDEAGPFGPGAPPGIDMENLERAFPLLPLVEEATEAQLDALCAQLVAEGLTLEKAEHVVGLAVALAALREAGGELPAFLQPPRGAKPKRTKGKPAKNSTTPPPPIQPDLF